MTLNLRPLKPDATGSSAWTIFSAVDRDRARGYDARVTCCILVLDSGTIVGDIYLRSLPLCKAWQSCSPR